MIQEGAILMTECKHNYNNLRSISCDVVFISITDVVCHGGTASHHAQLNQDNIRQDILLRWVFSFWVLLDAIPSRLTCAAQPPDTYVPHVPSSLMDQSRETVVEPINLQALFKYLVPCQGGRATKAQMENLGPSVHTQWSFHNWKNCFGYWHPEIQKCYVKLWRQKQNLFNQQPLNKE